MEHSGVFDPEVALERVEGDEELLQELIELFFEQSPGLLSEVARAIEAKNAKVLQRSTHSLRGSAGNLAAENAQDAAAKLEEMAATGSFDNTGEAYDNLVVEVNRLTEALRAHCAARLEE